MNSDSSLRSAPVTVAPHQPGDRLIALDVLRGVAVLAIFAVNIKSMAAPMAYYFNATLWTGSYDQHVSLTHAFLIDNKFRTIFTGLFGAGIVLFCERVVARDENPLPIMTRRLFWLLIFGLTHLLLIWNGDILTPYAIGGFFAMALWRLSAKRLWQVFAALFIVSFVWIAATDLTMLSNRVLIDDLDASIWSLDPDEVGRQYTTFLGSPLGQILARAEGAAGSFVFLYLFGGRIADTIAIMIGGMALWKSGFFSPSFPAHRYSIIFWIGFSVASGLTALQQIGLVISGWTVESFLVLDLLSLVIGPAGGLALAALILRIAQPSKSQPMGAGMRAVRNAFTAAGRMAFTLYISSSVIGTTLFYGHGFGLYGRLNLVELMGVVGLTWIFLLLFAALWLSFFRYGPIEWVWRSLTYKCAFPIRKRH